MQVVRAVGVADGVAEGVGAVEVLLRGVDERAVVVEHHGALTGCVKSVMVWASPMSSVSLANASMTVGVSSDVVIGSSTVSGVLLKKVR